MPDELPEFESSIGTVATELTVDHLLKARERMLREPEIEPSFSPLPPMHPAEARLWREFLDRHLPS